jgi:protein gp37
VGKDTGIKWTDSTFNPWWGCQRVSPGCEHCYAETFSKRVGLKIWGPGDRRQFGDKHWKEPLKWDAAAKASGKRHLVFCASMADVFEDRRDLDAPRARLWALIRDTPHLTWLLLTKRPQCADGLWTEAHTTALANGGSFDYRARDTWQPNIWLGTTVEDQRRADERIPHLLRVPAAVRFLSCEPLLSEVLLHRWFAGSGQWPADAAGGIDWVIGGGESGPGARPCDVAWLRSLRDQCAAAGVPYFNKQLGAKPVESGAAVKLDDPKGGDPDEWPTDLRVMEWPR